MKDKPKNFIDMTGFKHFDLTVVEIDEEKTNKVNRERIYWRCQCVCGNFRSIDGKQLRNGKARKNCGCVPVPQENPASKKNYTQEELQLKKVQKDI